MFNLYKCAISNSFVGVEAEASFTGHGGFFSYSKNNLKYAVWFFFSHKGKSNISFWTVKGLLLFVCIHNINIVLL